MKRNQNKISRSFSISRRIKDASDEIKALNEQLTLANEELIITNDELSAYKVQLEELVSIRTHELLKKEESLKYKNKLEKLIAETSTRSGFDSIVIADTSPFPNHERARPS